MNQGSVQWVQAQTWFMNLTLPWLQAYTKCLSPIPAAHHREDMLFNLEQVRGLFCLFSNINLFLCAEDILDNLLVLVVFDSNPLSASTNILAVQTISISAFDVTIPPRLWSSVMGLVDVCFLRSVFLLNYGCTSTRSSSISRSTSQAYDVSVLCQVVWVLHIVLVQYM